MARNNHTYRLDPLLEELDEQVSVLEETQGPARVEAIRLAVTLAYVRQLRDTLKRIALNQNGIPSHQAQNVLLAVGCDWNATAQTRQGSASETFHQKYGYEHQPGCDFYNAPFIDSRTKCTCDPTAFRKKPADSRQDVDPVCDRCGEPCCGCYTDEADAAGEGQKREQTINIFGVPVNIIAGASDDYIIFTHEGRWVGRIDIDLPLETAEQGRAE